MRQPGSGSRRLHAVMRRQDYGCAQIPFTVATDGRGRGVTAGSGTMVASKWWTAGRAMRCTYTLFDAAAGLRSAGRCGSFRQDTLLPALTPLYPESTDHNGMPRGGQNRRRCADVDRNRSFSQDWGVVAVTSLCRPSRHAPFRQCWPDSTEGASVGQIQFSKIGRGVLRRCAWIQHFIMHHATCALRPRRRASELVSR